ncbi:MAG TPA: hypothetical protein VF552_14775 [Allosphingosinicella sp.]|jgi:hypothetical protein
MIWHRLRALAAVAASAFTFLAAAPAAAQANLQPTPPEVPLWRTEANGDAVQTDLGFILPARIGAFERKGFSSTRPDGASVMAWYETPDTALRLRILIHLRVDVRGIPLEGDPLQTNWSFTARVAEGEHPDVTPETLSEGRIVWGTVQSPNAVERFTRFPLQAGPRVQGAWFRNFGLWAVLATVSGPEARRAEVEEAGRLVRDRQWPRGALGAELRTVSERLWQAPECGRGFDRSGTGRPTPIDGATAAMLGTALGMNFIDNRPADMPNPGLQPDDYCRIETFRIGPAEVVALGWRGDASRPWQARYAFYRRRSGDLYQFESPLPAADIPAALAAAGVRRLVQFTATSDAQATILDAYTDWPSYEEAKAIVLRTAPGGALPLVDALHPPGRLHVTINTGRVTGGAAAPPPTPGPAPTEPPRPPR